MSASVRFCRFRSGLRSLSAGASPLSLNAFAVACLHVRSVRAVPVGVQAASAMMTIRGMNSLVRFIILILSSVPPTLGGFPVGPVRVSGDLLDMASLFQKPHGDVASGVAGGALLGCGSGLSGPPWREFPPWPGFRPHREDGHRLTSFYRSALTVRFDGSGMYGSGDAGCFLRFGCVEVRIMSVYPSFTRCWWAGSGVNAERPAVSLLASCGVWLGDRCLLARSCYRDCRGVGELPPVGGAVGGLIHSSLSLIGLGVQSRQTLPWVRDTRDLSRSVLLSLSGLTSIVNAWAPSGKVSWW